MKKVLVTGGCGYIGSHTMVELINNGFEVISVDNNINSNLEPLEAVKTITGVAVENHTFDLCDLEKTRALFNAHPDLEGVIHFAALKAVGESVEKPWMYFHNNLNSLLNVMACAKEFNVNNLIFSSSCSVYGNAKALPVDEHTPMEAAESPYARTKQIGENMLRDFCVANKDFNAVLLRYFNPAGAHESGLMGESPVNPALNLVPVITETAIGKRSKLYVHGGDYNTRDGSCIRDYIHVMDLANAHTKAMQFLIENKNENNCEVYNLGIGEGASVLEAIKAFEESTGEKLNYEVGPRRPGDVEAIYCSYKKATSQLGWTPSRGIKEIMQTAWEWEKKRSAATHPSS